MRASTWQNFHLLYIPIICAEKEQVFYNTSQETGIAIDRDMWSTGDTKTEQAPAHRKTSDSCTSIPMTDSRTLVNCLCLQIFITHFAAFYYEQIFFFFYYLFIFLLWADFLLLMLVTSQVFCLLKFQRHLINSKSFFSQYFCNLKSNKQDS